MCFKVADFSGICCRFQAQSLLIFDVSLNYQWESVGLLVFWTNCCFLFVFTPLRDCLHRLSDSQTVWCGVVHRLKSLCLNLKTTISYWNLNKSSVLLYKRQFSVDPIWSHAPTTECRDNCHFSVSGSDVDSNERQISLKMDGSGLWPSPLCSHYAQICLGKCFTALKLWPNTSATNEDLWGFSSSKGTHFCYMMLERLFDWNKKSSLMF